MTTTQKFGTQKFGPSSTQRQRASRPLVAITDHLRQLSREAEGSQFLGRLYASGVCIGPETELVELLDQCLGTSSTARKSEVLRAVVSLAQDDQSAALCALILLRPQLERMAALMVRGSVDREEAEADVVAIAWEAVTGHLTRSSAAILSVSTLLNRIWTEIRRSTGMRRHVVLPVAWPDDFDPPAPLVDPLERCPGLLEQAVLQGLISPRQATLVALVRMEDQSSSVVARAMGRPYSALHKELRRAELALAPLARTYPSSVSL